MMRTARTFMHCVCLCLCGGVCQSFASEPQRDEFSHWVVGASVIEGDADVVLTLPGLPATLDRVDYSGHAVFFRLYPVSQIYLGVAMDSREGALQQLGSEISLESERIGLGWSQAWMRPTQLIQRLRADIELYRTHSKVDSNLSVGGMVIPVSASGYASRAETNITLHGEFGIALNVGSSVRIDDAARARANHWNLSKAVTDHITVAFGQRISDGDVGNQFSASLKEHTVSVAMRF